MTQKSEQHEGRSFEKPLSNTQPAIVFANPNCYNIHICRTTRSSYIMVQKAVSLAKYSPEAEIPAISVAVSIWEHP